MAGADSQQGRSGASPSGADAAAAAPSLWSRLSRRQPQPELTAPQSPTAATASVASGVAVPRQVLLSMAPGDAGAAVSAQPQSSASLHTTEWKDVNAGKFIGLTIFFSSVENALFYPFYMLKTREQADRLVLKPRPNAKPWDASMHHLRAVIAERGVRQGLFRGFWASNILSFPAYAAYMGVYTWAKGELGYTAEQQSSDKGFQLSSLYAPCIAAVAADAASVGLYVPGDIIVQRMQMKDSPYSNFSDALRQIYRTDGLQGFYRGFGATFVTSAIASGIWWVVYENAKTALYAGEQASEKAKALEALQRTGVAPPAPAENGAPKTLWEELTSVNRWPQLGAGFIAGTFTSSAINPLDVVKTRLQVQDAAIAQAAAAAKRAGPGHVAAPVPVRYKHMVHGLYRIWIDEGARGYWRGIMPKLVSRGPLSAMTSLLYEVVLHLSRNSPAQRANNNNAQFQ